MKNKQIFIILAVLLAGALLYFNQKPQEIGLKVRYYDVNKKEIFSTNKLFSIITPPGKQADYISFDVIGKATDTPISNITIMDASPVEFKNALPTTMQSLDFYETKILWSSSLIETQPLESYAQPINFWIKLEGIEEYAQTLKYAEFSLDLKIEKMGECKTIPLQGTPFAIKNIYNDSYGCKHWSFKTYCPISPLPEGTTITTATISASRICTRYWMWACSPCGQFSFGGNCWYDAYCEGGGERCDTAYCTQLTYSIPDYGGLA